MGNLCSCFKGNKRDDESERLLDGQSDRHRSTDYQSSSMRSPLRSAHHGINSNGHYHHNMSNGGSSGGRNYSHLTNDITVHQVDSEGNYTHLVDTSISGHYDDSANKSATIWDRTLHKLQEKLIDVSTLDVNPKINESSEWIEKQAEYMKKVENNKLLGPALDKIVASRHFSSMAKPSGSHLRSELCQKISSNDIESITKFSQEASAYFSNQFTIHSAETIVVPFTS